MSLSFSKEVLSMVDITHIVAIFITFYVIIQTDRTQ